MRPWISLMHALRLRLRKFVDLVDQWLFEKQKVEYFDERPLT